MFSNLLLNDSSVSPEKGLKKTLYQKFQNLLGRGTEDDNISVNESIMSSTRESTSVNDNNFLTPVSSEGDLLAMSPKRTSELSQHKTNETSDLTESDFDSICDVTMKEVPFSDNIFIDSTNLDFLEKCAQTNRNLTDIDRGKESLFIKFDPLYARQKLEDCNSVITESVVDSLDADVGYETGSTLSVFTESNVTVPRHSQSMGSIPCVSSKDKPMQVVRPVLSNDTPKTSECNVRPTPGLMRSVSVILTPTRVATERLISITGNTPPIAAPRTPRYNHSISTQDLDHLQTLRSTLLKQEQEVLQLRLQNMEFKSTIQEMEHNHNRVKEDLESKVKKLTDDKNHYIKRESELIEQIYHKDLSHKQMRIVTEEYKKTITAMIEQQQKDKSFYEQNLDKVTAERDQALNHLTNMESAFNDLLTKYEKCKSVILELKDREQVYEQKLTEYKTAVKKYEELYGNLKKVTTDALNEANETLDNLKKNYNNEITKLSATVKKHEISIASLQESLVHKTRDNEELMKLYDQLLSKLN